MKKIIVNGHGWSGSSAFINFLESSESSEYVIIPGEFDDFRVPGTMREVFDDSKTPTSHRWNNLKPSLSMKIRSLVPDILWPDIERGRHIKRLDAIRRTSGIKREHVIFNKYKSLLTKEKNPEKKKDLLNAWLNAICKNYLDFNAKTKNVIIEQFFLFDDCPLLYDWVNFDNLILFIRSPDTQITATLESNVLYNDYPWGAEFLLGQPHTLRRKYQIFLDTTSKRYEWIINFLNNFDDNKIIIVDFNSFLFNHKNTIKEISNIIDVDLSNNLSAFNIEDSIKRNNIWNNKVEDLEKEIEKTNLSYEKFKNNLSQKYKLI